MINPQQQLTSEQGEKIEEFKRKLDMLAAEYAVQLIVMPRFEIHVLPAVVPNMVVPATGALNVKI